MNDQNEKLERETATITLPHSKVIIEYFTYLKAKEILGIQSAKDGNKYLYETLVVSVNGDKTGIYEKVTDLRYSDYKVLDNIFVKMLKDDVTGENNEEKKTSLTDTTIISEEMEASHHQQ